jgi:enhancing lycopene biosynthesis protein 2
LALDQKGIAYQCAAPNENQYHVINHTNGEEMEPSRNILIESARIARGDIKDLSTVKMEDYLGLVLPGGFGAAKNLSHWAFDGPGGKVNSETARVIREAHALGLPIAAFCMSPVVLSKAFEKSGVNPELTVGTNSENSPYEIEAISNGMESLGAKATMATVRDVVVDSENKIVTTPCYMMEAGIAEVHNGIQKAINEFASLL